MDATFILLCCSIAVAVLYLGIATVKGRTLPESLSAMVYLLKGGWRWLWTLWLWTVTLLLLPSLMDALPEGWGIVGLLTAADLLMVGAMPLFVREHRRYHYGFAVAAGVLSQVCVALICWQWLALWTVIIILHGLGTTPGTAGVPRWLEGRGTLVAEVICTAAVYGPLVVRHL